MPQPRIVKRVIKYYGGPSALADILGVSRQAVAQWQQIPLRYLKQIAQDTKIPREKLRPDLYA
jgi:DNA-binding transcriptional regulator YdaS (Cro superfamily)